MNERVVLYFEIIEKKIVTQVDFLWFLTANLFVAFISNFLVHADQNTMSCVGGGLTFHLGEKAFGRFISRNMNLNGIMNICTDD